MVTLTINRDPVHPGDDLKSHEKSIVVSPDTSISQVLKEIQPKWYLPHMGGKATWIFGTLRSQESRFREPNPYWIEKSLAVVAEQWREPRFLLSPETSITECLNPDNFGKLHFHYWNQMDSTDVFERLQAGLPPPDPFLDAEPIHQSARPQQMARRGWRTRWLRLKDLLR